MVLVIRFLGGQVVAPGGFAFPLRRASVSGHVTEALLYRQLLDLGGTLVSHAGLVVAVLLTQMRLPVALVGTLGALRGALEVLLRDGLSGGEIPAPAQQFFGALGGFATR